MNADRLSPALSKRYERKVAFRIFFLWYLAITLAMIGLGKAYLALNDDPYLWDFLAHGENRTLIMSYPLSSLLVFLYEKFPGVQWFSWTMLIYGVVLNGLFAWYTAHLKDRLSRILMLLVLSLADIFLWYHFSITLLTMFVAVFSFVFLPGRERLFWLFFISATLLRDEIVFGVMPLFAVVYVMLTDKKNYSLNRLAETILMLAIVAGIHFSAHLDKEYRDWLSYHEARVYFTDLGGEDVKNVLDEDEKLFARSWFNQDERLISNQKVIDAAGSHLEVIAGRFSHINWRRVAGRIYHHKVILFLLLATGFLLWREKHKKLDMALLAVFIIGFFILIYVRDASRVTFPLLFLWLVMTVKYLNEMKEFKKVRWLLVGAFATFLLDLPIYGEHTKQDIALRDEVVALMKKHPELLPYEPAITFPRAYNGDIGTAMTQNRLFDEKEWIPNYVLPAGWICRHPYFYKTHRISTQSTPREFGEYHDYMVDESTAFIGSNEINDELNEKILKLMDKVYLQGTACHHVIETVDRSEHFSIVKIRVVCEKGR